MRSTFFMQRWSNTNRLIKNKNHRNIAMLVALRFGPSTHHFYIVSPYYKKELAKNITWSPQKYTLILRCIKELTREIRRDYYLVYDLTSRYSRTKSSFLCVQWRDTKDALMHIHTHSYTAIPLSLSFLLFLSHSLNVLMYK